MPKPVLWGKQTNNAKRNLLKRVPTIYVVSRNLKNIIIFHLKIFILFGGKLFSIFKIGMFS